MKLPFSMSPVTQDHCSTALLSNPCSTASMKDYGAMSGQIPNWDYSCYLSPSPRVVLQYSATSDHQRASLEPCWNKARSSLHSEALKQNWWFSGTLVIAQKIIVLFLQMHQQHVWDENNSGSGRSRTVQWDPKSRCPPCSAANMEL